MEQIRQSWAANCKTMKNNPIITIGRQYGSGGRSIANELGRRLGIPVYDNALLSEASENCGYSPDIFKKRDEKKHLFSFSRLFSSLYSNAENYMADDELFQIQSETILKIAQEGPCIIVGRCANYVLRDYRDRLLNVFITSPYETRVQRVMERIGVDEATAGKIITRKEKNRAEYYHYYTLGKWGDGPTYDLCIDSSILGIEGTAEIITDFAKAKGILE